MAERKFLRPNVTYDGQRYMDEPIYQVINPRPEFASRIADAVARAFGSRPLGAISVLTGHDRVRLRWMTGDGSGGLKPRDS